MPNTFLADSKGIIWLLTATNTGQLQTTVVSGGTNVFFAIPLNDSTTTGLSWNLFVGTDGLLRTTSIAAFTYPTQLLVNAPNGAVWIIQVNKGQLETLPGDVQVPTTSILTQVDTWELDNATSNPLDTSTPIAWNENLLDQQRFVIAPTPAQNGTINFLYIQLAQTLTGAGVTFVVPDDWTPYIMWGALAELFGSDGPAYDPVRAAYCVQRYDEGVELARLVLGGSQ